MKTLAVLALTLWSLNATALSFNGTTCDSINVTPQLVVTCQNGTTTTTTITTPDSPPVVVTPSPAASNNLPVTVQCSLLYNAGTQAATLYALCSPAASRFDWSEPTCSKTVSNCQVRPTVTPTTYSMTGSNATGKSNTATVAVTLAGH
jgi:hypothetical protein